MRMLFLLVAILILLGGAFAFPHIRFWMTSGEKPPGVSRVDVVGHRGSREAPENTLAAFRLGMQSADIIELDVHLSKDGSVIVAHDATAERTTNGAGAWVDLTLEEIRKLDAGSWYGSAFQGEKVPTLEEVLTLVNGNKTVLIELKWPETGIYDSLVTHVVRMIRGHQAERWTIVQSFEPRYLTELHRLAPDLITYELVYGALNFPPVWKDRNFHMGVFNPVEGVRGVVFYYPYLSASFVQKLHAHRMRVGAYTVNKGEDIFRVLNLGVDLVITDYPAQLRSTLAN